MRHTVSEAIEVAWATVCRQNVRFSKLFIVEILRLSYEQRSPRKNRVNQQNTEPNPSFFFEKIHSDNREKRERNYSSPEGRSEPPPPIDKKCDNFAHRARGVRRVIFRVNRFSCKR